MIVKQRRNAMIANCFESITREQVMDNPLPLKKILQNSLYYPACGLDGGVIKYCNTLGRDMGIRSFVYCDYNTKEDELCENVIHHFRGYSVFANRSVKEDELGFKYVHARTIEEMVHRSHIISKCKPFCHWFIMKREEEFDETHGPDFFSLLYLCYEGVLAYVQLYCHNKIVPTVLAIIQPGTGFGGNWTDFRDKNGHLSFVVNDTPQGTPRWLFNGGLGNSEDDYTDLDWDGYMIADKIANYYGPGKGRMVVYKRR